MNLCIEFLTDSEALRHVPGYGWGVVAGDKAMVPFSVGVRLVAHDIATLVNPTPAAVKAVEAEQLAAKRLRLAATLAQSAKEQRDFIPAGEDWLKGATIQNARQVAIHGMRRG